MWWNNVETKPGTGYPTKWEDQDIYKGGWEKTNKSLKLKGAGKSKGLGNIFHNPNMPTVDDYYEPWTYNYENLFDAPEGDDQPVARPISLITGKNMDPMAGPNWDDDLSGSKDYARQDTNLKNVTEQEKQAMFQLERMAMFYLPRICNHCINPACVAACPSGAIYKRGEDGIVLINQNKCRAWRMCVTACPYKKSYFNWKGGKSEKCILCFPRLESGQIPACMHSCVGRIRYLGAMLYDADRIKEIATCDETEIVKKQREIYLDPFDEKVIEEAKKNGIADSTIESAQKSPVWKFVKEWEIALPLHPEFRTIPNLFYVPPLLPAMANVENSKYDSTSDSLWAGIEKSRLPMEYLASLFSAGNTGVIKKVLKKLMAVRLHRRDKTVGDLSEKEIAFALNDSGLNTEVADEIFRLTSLPRYNERFIIPPAHKEEAKELLVNTDDLKGGGGFGFRTESERIP